MCIVQLLGCLTVLFIVTLIEAMNSTFAISVRIKKSLFCIGAQAGVCLVNFLGEVRVIVVVLLNTACNYVASRLIMTS
jgi:hypothetical protein